MLERGNFKIIANFLCIELSLSKNIMPVNPFENHKDSKSSVIGIKETLRHLSDGKPLECFQPEKFPVTKTANLWSTNHGKKELLK
jgi:hypothetical protein